jgi:hypothetical protein
LIFAGLIIYYFDEKNILPMISLFAGIVYLSQNQPLQYENKPQIRVITVLALLFSVAFFLINWLIIDEKEYKMTKILGYVLSGLNLLYFIKGVTYRSKFNR